MNQVEDKVIMNTKSLNEAQIRILKQINFLSIQMMSTECEVEFFEKSSLLMKMVANAVKKSEFGSDQNMSFDKIPYATQAIEYALEQLEDKLQADDVESFDH